MDWTIEYAGLLHSDIVAGNMASIYYCSFLLWLEILGVASCNVYFQEITYIVFLLLYFLWIPHKSLNCPEPMDQRHPMFWSGEEIGERKVGSSGHKAWLKLLQATFQLGMLVFHQGDMKWIFRSGTKKNMCEIAHI